MTEDELKKDVKKFTTTYDKTYLDNIDKNDENKKVQYLIEFKTTFTATALKSTPTSSRSARTRRGFRKFSKGL